MKSIAPKDISNKRGDSTRHLLVVDLDGTLIRTDMLHESALRVFRDHPWDTPRIPFWIARGRAVLKQNLALRTDFDPKTLPYNEELLGWLKNQRSEGRKLILCTASDRSIAISIAEHLDIFDEVIASDGSKNIAGEHKAETLEQRFGRSGFDYVGNSKADVPVWERARCAVVVNASGSLTKKVETLCMIERIFPRNYRSFSAWWQVLRVHQWLKNLLLFVPLLASHELTDTDVWFSLILAFLSFSFCASSTYIINDLLDLDSDRQHPRKRNRPFASGLVPVWIGILLAPSLLVCGMGIGSLVGGQFLSWLVFYFSLTCAYSWILKRSVLIDCLTLALLYTLRIVAGAVVAGHALSFWLLAFSVFLFLSLAFVKRYAELNVQRPGRKEKIHGRGYHTTDAPLIQTMGIVAGYASVLVLALYLDSDTVVKLYRSPELVWGTVPVMLFWISWIWMRAHRGEMHDDPLVFAIKDRASLAAGVVFTVVLVAGTVGLPW
uniref:4-hydroxybenzoate polyprenyltransferase n=1 Tax=Candidatus Kentrum sp. FW TaxID=2126338 RepID=A0A450TK69_9GAMM|nr:MAG: 4-hydroxybenzoate polyprenyltransferase [Candidatus Kentron sp. FW]